MDYGLAGVWFVVLAALGLSTLAIGAVDVPLTIREFDGLARQGEPVAAGVPLPMGAVKSTDALAMLGPDGKPVPATFTSLASWADGSVKWVLCDWTADLKPLEQGVWRLTDQAKAAQPVKPLFIDNDTNELTVDTGVLRFVIGYHGFTGFSKVWMDLDGDGDLSPASPVIVGHRDTGGLVAVGPEGEVYTGQFGQVGKVTVERQGDSHATIHIRGDLRDRQGERPFLDYDLRLGVQAGSSRVRMVCTIGNPNSAGRINGDRWVLGQRGSVLFESLDFVIPVETQNLRRVSLSAGAGQLWDRIPDPPTMTLYQDSSGGENWFHRAHVNRDNRIPLTFKGWRAQYGQTQIGQGDRAEPWIDLSDMRWGVAVGMPGFWQNFPKALTVDANDIRIGLWPGQFDDLHELQGGERKTHTWTVYFHHRRKSDRFGQMPYERDVMAAVHHPLRAWAPAAWYFASGVFDPQIGRASCRERV